MKSEVLILALVSIVAIIGLALISYPAKTGSVICAPGQVMKYSVSDGGVGYFECAALVDEVVVSVVEVDGKRIETRRYKNAQLLRFFL